MMIDKKERKSPLAEEHERLTREAQVVLARDAQAILARGVLYERSPAKKTRRATARRTTAPRADG